MDRTGCIVETIDIVVGFDQREAVAHHVFVSRYLSIRADQLDFFR